MAYSEDFVTCDNFNKERGACVDCQAFTAGGCSQYIRLRETTRLAKLDRTWHFCYFCDHPPSSHEQRPILCMQGGLATSPTFNAKDFTGIGATANEPDSLAPIVSNYTSTSNMTADIHPPKRQPKECPVCNKKVVLLSRHLNLHPQLTKLEIKNICYNKRKRISSNSISKRRKCPYPECSDLDPQLRLDKHLIFRHKLSQLDEEYKKFIKFRSSCVGYNNTSNANGSKKYSNFSNYICKDFERYAVTLYVGYSKKENAKQKSLKLRQILDGMEAKTLVGITKNDAIASLKSWIDEYSQNHEYSSTAIYLGVYLSFLKYIRFLNDPHANSDKDITRAEELIGRWIKGYKRKFGFSFGGKNSNEICPDEIMKFENSQPYKKALNHLHSIKEGHTEFSKTSHAELRNTLLLTIILRNACRPCALANMKMVEFANAIIHSGSGDNIYYTVGTKDHKTYASHGPAPITLTKQLYEDVLLFSNSARKWIERKCPGIILGDHVFYTERGKKINSDDLGKGLNNIWNQCGFKSRFNCTLVRKTIITKVHSNDEKNKEGMAHQMWHRLSTAEKRYKFQMKATESVHQSNVVYHTLRGEPQNVPCDSYTVMPNLRTVVSSVNGVEEEQVAKPKRTRGRAFFTDNERELLSDVFRDFIENGAEPKLSTIANIVEEDERLQNMKSMNRCFPTKIKGAIHNLVVKRRNKF